MTVTEDQTATLCEMPKINITEECKKYSLVNAINESQMEMKNIFLSECFMTIKELSKI